MNIYPRNILPVKNVRRFIVIFYIVGVLGFIIPYSREIFKIITPLALILNIYLLAIYHKDFGIKDIFVFIFVLVVGFIIEVLGVKTGLIFGSYSYGDSLGFKLFDTPVIIGINWLFLVYTSTSVAEYLKFKKSIVIIIAPLLMLLYDFVLEQVAPQMDMWSWYESLIPLKNYLAWYIMGLGFVMLFKVYKIDTKNPVSTLLFVCQFVFFVFLTFFLN
ncbi:MAG: carotenoid biosynthesis protein [Marinilabiliaceae bacterium]|nr:carotenoid biosynthesis protein [Marinilabiliaceae bacterium]